MIQYVLEYSVIRHYINEYLWLPFVAFPLVCIMSLVLTLFI